MKDSKKTNRTTLRQTITNVMSAPYDPMSIHIDRDAEGIWNDDPVRGYQPGSTAIPFDALLSAYENNYRITCETIGFPVLSVSRPLVNANGNPEDIPSVLTVAVGIGAPPITLVSIVRYVDVHKGQRLVVTTTTDPFAVKVNVEETTKNN